MNKTIDLNNKTILISRTDSIGDVVLTLPLCVWIKNKFPKAKIIFLGNTYTKAVLQCLPEIDEIIEWASLKQLPEPDKTALLKSRSIDVCIHVFPNKEIAALVKRAKIPVRVGTSHRVFHLFTCNIRLKFSRKNSNFHESQLNFELLKPFGIKELPGLDEITLLMRSFKPKQVELPELLSADLKKPTKKIILHAKSQGSAMEWPLEKYATVADNLLSQGFSVYYTGTEQEGKYIRPFINTHENCIDTTGELSLEQLIYFISECDALVACSTGPLHLAGILGLKTVGLFSPKKPIHPGRWKALGTDVHILVEDESKVDHSQNLIEQIEPERVIKLLLKIKSES